VIRFKQLATAPSGDCGYKLITNVNKNHLN
jgi:hypothetical protein